MKLNDEFSSVRSSRINSQLSALISSKTYTPSIASSVPRTVLSSHLTEKLAEQLVVDEYGYTDKQCRTCGARIRSLMRVISLLVNLFLFFGLAITTSRCGLVFSI